MFKAYKLLPDEIGRQDPRRLFELLDELNAGESNNSSGSSYDSPYIRAVMG